MRPMKSYELTLLISPNLSEEELSLLQKDLTAWIQDSDSFVFETWNLKRVLLGFPLKKQRAAWQVILEFQGDPEKIATLDKKLNERAEILRYIISKKVVEKARRKMPPKIIPGPMPPKKKPEKKKVELKEIEKKLEEILDEL